MNGVQQELRLTLPSRESVTVNRIHQRCIDSCPPPASRRGLSVRGKTLVLWFVLIVSLVFIPSLSSPLHAQATGVRQTLHTHVRPAVANGDAKLLGVVPRGQTMRLSIVLALRNQDALTSLLTRLYDPSSPD